MRELEEKKQKIRKQVQREHEQKRKDAERENSLRRKETLNRSKLSDMNKSSQKIKKLAEDQSEKKKNVFHQSFSKLTQSLRRTLSKRDGSKQPSDNKQNVVNKQKIGPANDSRNATGRGSGLESSDKDTQQYSDDQNRPVFNQK